MNYLQILFVTLLILTTLFILQFTRVVFKWAKVRDGGSLPALNRVLLGRTGESGESANWAFYLHRLSGIAIALFLPLHILDIAVFAFLPSEFEELHAIYGTTPMRIFECGLLFGLLFHSLNGIRIILVDYFDLSTKVAARTLQSLTLVVIALTAWGSVIILGPVFA
jgi:succinate dehydrogenase / fumarate reductase cytochrome b subunit